MTDRTKGYLYGAASAAAYGINPVAKIMYDDGMDVDSVLCCRYLWAIAFLAILMKARHESFRISGKETILLIIMGLLFSISSITLFLSYQYIDVSIASTLLFCYPAMVAIIMMTLFKEKPTPITISAIILVGIGVTILNADGDGSIDNIFGVGIVILSSLVYAIYIVCVQKTCISRTSSLKVAFYSILFGSSIYIIRLKGLTDIILPPTPRSTICAVALAIFPTFVSITTLAMAIKYIGSTATAILGALEPVTAVLIGIILFGERPTFLNITGMVIIILAVTILVAAPKIKAFRNSNAIKNIGKTTVLKQLKNKQSSQPPTTPDTSNSSNNN